MMNHNIFIITGGQGKGKTTFLLELSKLLKNAGLPIAGFCAPGYWKEGKRSGFDLMEINGVKQVCLCNTTCDAGDIPFRRFFFKHSALSYGNQLLVSAAGTNNIVFIDEIGPLEMEGNAWANGLNQLVQNPPLALVVAVRSNLLAEIAGKWGMNADVVFDIERNTPSEVFDKLNELFNHD
ncbi:MAG: nucleoside-triphosphatase [Bacteroidales bacterium]|nr:nucleoside-triphosphatase [Bacteroidales bacterium]MDZ4204569.1 nucleoside-triphosphatase [Bacteroidales bacterium]